MATNKTKSEPKKRTVKIDLDKWISYGAYATNEQAISRYKTVNSWSAAKCKDEGIIPKSAIIAFRHSGLKGGWAEQRYIVWVKKVAGLSWVMERIK